MSSDRTYTESELNEILGHECEAVRRLGNCRKHMLAGRPLNAHVWRCLANLERTFTDRIRGINTVGSFDAVVDSLTCAQHYADLYSEWK